MILLISHTFMQCPLLKGMQLTYTAWVESLKTRDDGRAKTYRPCQNLKSLSLHDLSNGRNLLGVSYTTSPRSNLCTALTTQNTIENTLHAQNTTALRPSVFVTGIRRLLVTAKDGWLTSVQTTVKVNRTLHNHYL
jgi:hypothetical protein